MSTKKRVVCAVVAAAAGISLLCGFGFAKKVGNSSVFASTYVECMKKPFKGRMGHIAVATNSVKRAMYQLTERGYTIDEESVKRDAKGTPTVAYLKEDFGGFAVHLVLRK